MIKCLTHRDLEYMTNLIKELNEYIIKGKSQFKQLGIEDIGDYEQFKRQEEIYAETYYLFIMGLKRIYIENNNGKFRVIKSNFKINAENEKIKIDCENFEEAKKIFKNLVNNYVKEKGVLFDDM